MEALEPSSADPLPPASGLSAPPPVPISFSSRPPVKDPTSTIPSTHSAAAASSTTHQPRSGIVSPVDDPVTSVTTTAAVPKEKENSSPRDASTPTPPSNKWPSLRSTTTTTTRMLPPTANAALAKPLVPLSERRSHQRKPTPRSFKDSDSDHQGSLPRWDITPDGGSAGREGRQFTVANVGNNGRIYLRPTVRPAYQRCPQPQFVFPITPPSTAGLDTLPHSKPVEYESSELHISQFTPTPEATPFDSNQAYFEADPRDPLRSVKHRRALSDSTVHEVSAAKDSDPGVFKIVISKPGEEHRPRTMEDF
ncbi:hypothetical protein CEP52_015890 [Fusarium oligoseptatum]|nr:hypothetical protein CEP52_015890 [Fusarium oligoseptatum]